MNKSKITFLVLLLPAFFSCQDQHLSCEELEANFLGKLVGTWQVDGDQSFEEWALTTEPFLARKLNR